MAGIYIHIPFCRKACHYCNFHFSTSLKGKNDFIAALLKEIVLRKNYTGAELIETIYLGGGTPSLLSAGELEQILSAIRQHYPVDPGAEITLEANPDDIDDQKAEDWQQAGINRLSIGVQSFFDEDLQWMNRAHDAGRALEAIRTARRHGFYNITIDLIYGVPGLTDKRWKKNITLALELDIPHLSCYALTVEPATALYKMIAQQKKSDVVPEDQARQFGLLTQALEAGGYEHYEISNFARPDYRSRHNSSYWQGKKYLGLGPSSHSFNGYSRQWNVANNALYIQGLDKGLPQTETEILTASQQLNEYIMLSLRTAEGIDLNRVTREFGPEETTRIRNLAAKYIQRQRVELTIDRIQLTPVGKLFADGIAADFFI